MMERHKEIIYFPNLGSWKILLGYLETGIELCFGKIFG